MKKIILILLTTLSSQAQWEPDVRLTNNISNSYTSYNNARCIAAGGPVLHAVFWDYRDGNYELYYKRSVNGGITWAADTRLTFNTAASEYPSITVYGQVVHIVWHEFRDGNWEIYYKRSTDAGINWGADTRLTNNTAESRHPSITVSAQTVHLVWHDNRDGNYEIYYKRSTDGGMSWGADTRITINNAGSYSPSVSVSAQAVHLVWYDNRGMQDEIYYKRSTDGGISWGADLPLTTDDGFYSPVPCIAVKDQFVHVVWHDFRDNDWEIYYKRSSNGGISWGPDTRLTNEGGGSMWASVAVSESPEFSGVHVVWHDSRNNGTEIYYKRSTDEGISWEADLRLTYDPYVSEFASVAVSGSFVHVIWCDGRNGNPEIYYKRNPTGNPPTGIIIIGSEVPAGFSLSQNYPNPFNPATNVEFSIPKSGFVNLTIYDAMGREVETLVNGDLKPGTYKADWDAANYPSGVYFYRLNAGSFTETKRMVLIK